jgi:PST family polysaccharide transporter
LPHPVVGNAIALYGVAAVNYLLPLATVPYLARILGPNAWGEVVFAQAFGTWLALVLDYGFSWSATRDVARCRGDRGRLPAVVSSVLGAKAVLAVLLVLATAASTLVVSRERAVFLWLACGYALAQGFSPLWYYQGIERLRTPAALDMVARTVVAALTFVVVRAPTDGWKVLALMLAGAAISAGLPLAWLFGAVSIPRPRLGAALDRLREGSTLFVVSGASALYGSATVLILGVQVSVHDVGLYGGAERIHRAFSSLFGPLSQAVYPHIAHTAHGEPDRARQLAGWSLAIMGGLGLVLGGLAAAGAGWWTALLLGPRFTGSVPLLRILALQLPLTGASRVLGAQWMLSVGLDRSFARIVVAAALIHLALVPALVAVLGAAGAAWAFVTTEAFVTLAIVVALHRAGQALWPAGGGGR